MLLVPICIIAQIPQTMNYQGKLEDNSGNPVDDGNYTVVFTIYDAATLGNSLWTETRTITTEDGFFGLTLGENTLININTEGQLWLNINVDGTDLTPRTKLAGNLSTLSSKSIENTESAGNSVVNAINTSTGGINSSKLADGSVSNTELQYLDNVNENIQTQLDDKQRNLPSQLGHGDQYLFTDGENMSWQSVSSGSSVTRNELSVSSDIDITTDTYVDITGVSLNLEANSTYLIKGILGAERTGIRSKINIKLDYTGTTNMNILTVGTSNSVETGEIISYLIVSNNTIKHIVNGMIDTGTAGTFQLKISKSLSGDDASKITTNTKLIVLKIK